MYAKKSQTQLLMVTSGLLLIGLTIFIFLDLLAAISVYLPFTLSYTTFWLIMAGILLRWHPQSSRWLTLSLFIAAILVIYAINWDSRKVFLKDFRQVEPGMAVAQVEQVMQGYTKFIGPASQINEQGEVVAGTISYRHTQAGWGDADIGLIVIENGQVAQTEFYPD